MAHVQGAGSADVAAGDGAGASSVDGGGAGTASKAHAQHPCSTAQNGVQRGAHTASGGDDCIRAENEDDDGYDPYSDRKPPRDPLFERDPWR